MPQNDRSTFGTDTSRRTLLKFLGTGAAALGATGLLSACGGGGSAAEAKPGAITSMGIASAPGDVYLMDEIAQKNKIFANHSIKSEKLIYPQSGVQGMQLLTAGAINAMQQDTLMTFTAFARGTKGTRPKIIGMRMPTITYSIVVNKNFKGADASASFEEKMKSLEGKTVGVTAIGSGSELQLHLALQMAGMKPDAATSLAVGQFSPMIAQMNANRVDAVVTQTWATGRLLAQLTGGTLYVELADPSVPDLISGQEVGPLIVREDWIDSNPEAIKNFLAVQTETKDWMLANKKESADHLNAISFDGKAADLSLSYVEDWAAKVVPKMDPSWKMSRESFDRMNEVGIRLGTLKKGEVKYEDIVADFAQA